MMIELTNETDCTTSSIIFDYKDSKLYIHYYYRKYDNICEDFERYTDQISHVITDIVDSKDTFCNKMIFVLNRIIDDNSKDKYQVDFNVKTKNNKTIECMLIISYNQIIIKSNNREIIFDYKKDNLDDWRNLRQMFADIITK